MPEKLRLSRVVEPAGVGVTPLGYVGSGVRTSYDDARFRTAVRSYLQTFAPSDVTRERAIEPNAELIGAPLFAYG